MNNFRPSLQLSVPMACCCFLTTCVILWGGIYTYYLSVWCWFKIYRMIKYIFLSFLMKTVLSNLFKSCLFCCVSSSMVELFQGDKKQMGMTSRLRQLTMGTAESYQHPLCAKINESSNSRRTYKVQICWLLPVRACNEQQCSVWICSHTFKHLKALFFFSPKYLLTLFPLLT